MDRSPQTDAHWQGKRAPLSEHASAVPGHHWVGLHGLEYPTLDQTWGVALLAMRETWIFMFIIKGKLFPGC